MLLRRNLRRTICIMFLSLFVFLSGTECYADGIVDGGDFEIKPLYENIAFADAGFQISADGVAEMKCVLEPERGITLDKVTFNMIIAKADGTIFYNKTFTATYERITGRYIVSKTFKLTRRGNYQLRASAQCYRDGKIVETIKTLIVKDSY